MTTFQVLINGVWMLVSPPKVIHHYPSRESNILVCSSFINTSYVIAFGYPIVLIVVCTVYAVLTRNIPEAFNESKHIGEWLFTWRLYNYIGSGKIRRSRMQSLDFVVIYIRVYYMLYIVDNPRKLPSINLVKLTPLINEI